MRRRAGSPRTSPDFRWHRAEPVLPSAATPSECAECRPRGPARRRRTATGRLDAEIEEQERHRDVALRQADSLRAPAKPNPCSRPKMKATIHGSICREPRAAPSCLHDLGRHEHDAERDHRLDRSRGYMDDPQRREPERDAVRDGERRHRLHQPPCPFVRSSRASTNSRWSMPVRMCSMPSARYVPATLQALGRVGMRDQAAAA